MNFQDGAAAFGGTEVIKRTALSPLQTILEHLPLAAYASDAGGRIIWFNNCAADLWGRRPRIGDHTELFCGSCKLDLDGRLIGREQTPMAQVLRTGIPVREAEGRLERPDGSHVPAVFYITPVRDEEGNIVGAINCFHERTDRGRFEDREVRPDDPIRVPDERLAATYEHVGAGIVEVDQEGRILRVNQRLCELTGHAAPELLGRTIFQETLPQDVEEDRVQFRRQLSGQVDRYTIEKRIYRKDGGYFWASVTSSSVRDAAGNFLYAVRVQCDIDDRKRAEVALARRMDEQAALFKFSERLQHCSTEKDVNEAALDAITKALNCDRAAVLLFDAADVMRFVAWRGLSEEYRCAVEGHSPWTKEEEYPRPLCIGNVEEAELGRDLKRTILREEIRATAFIPLFKDGKLAGKFMAYYRHPHDFSEPEIEVGLAIARLLGFSLSRLASEEARRLAGRDARQLAAIVESSEDAIISKNLEGVIQTWNAGAERLFGYTSEEAVGRPITMLIPADRQEEEPHILSRIRKGERMHHFETVRRRKDGSFFDISLTISPILDGGRVVGASKIARDITERKRAQARLQESERRLQELLAAIPAAIYTTDAAGRITYFNEAAVELAGRRPQIGNDEWCVTWKLYNPDGSRLPHEECPMAICLEEGRAVRGAEAVAERPDGTRIPFIPFPTPLRDPSGNVVGAINMLVDISERKQAESQQRLLLNELNHRTKNNLQVLQSLLFSASKNTKSQEAMQVLAEASRRIAAMAAAQRVLYGTTDASNFDIGGFLQAVTETIRQTLPPDVMIVCDRARGTLSNDAAMPLALILNELITNAAKHGAGPGSHEVRVGLSESNGEFDLYVEDGGPGFDMEMVRSSSSGLRLVAGLARQLHGDFTVTKSPSRAILRFGPEKIG